MRDLPAPGPTAQQALARMYAQRVPSRPKQIGRMPEQKVDQPWYKDVANALGTAGKTTWGIVASPFATALDVVPGYEPENVGSFNIFEQGGKSLQHVAGDAYQLGRSVLTGKDTLSESPSARAYQQAGGGLMGTAAAAFPYVDVASAVAPFAKGMTPAGALAIERAAGEAASSRALAGGIANARPLTRPSAALAEEMVGRATVERPASNVIQFPGKRVQSSAEPIMSGNKAFLDELTRPTSFDTEAGLDIQQRHMSMYEPNAVGTNPEFGVTYDLVWAADNPYAIDITETYGEGVEQIKQTLRALADKHGLPIVGPFTEDPDYYRAFLELNNEGFPVRLLDKQDSWQMVNVDGEQFKQLRPEVSRPSAALAEQMANRVLPERPTIWMKPKEPFARVVAQTNDYQIIDPNGYLPFEPAKTETPFTGVRSNIPMKQPEWMRYGDIDPYSNLSPEEFVKLRELDMPRNVEAKFTRATNGTSQLPEPNPIEPNLDYSVYESTNDIDLTRVFANDAEAAVIGGVAQDKYAAQQEFRKIAIKWLRDNRVLNNLPYATLPETYVNSQTINDLLIKHPDLQNIYIDMMWPRGL